MMKATNLSMATVFVSVGLLWSMNGDAACEPTMFGCFPIVFQEAQYSPCDTYVYAYDFAQAASERGLLYSKCIDITASNAPDCSLSDYVLDVPDGHFSFLSTHGDTLTGAFSTEFCLTQDRQEQLFQFYENNPILMLPPNSVGTSVISDNTGTYYGITLEPAGLSAKWWGHWTDDFPVLYLNYCSSNRALDSMFDAYERTRVATVGYANPVNLSKACAEGVTFMQAFACVAPNSGGTVRAAAEYVRSLIPRPEIAVSGRDDNVMSCGSGCVRSGRGVDVPVSGGSYRSSGNSAGGIREWGDPAGIAGVRVADCLDDGGLRSELGRGMAGGKRDEGTGPGSLNGVVGSGVDLYGAARAGRAVTIDCQECADVVVYASSAHASLAAGVGSHFAANDAYFAPGFNQIVKVVYGGGSAADAKAKLKDVVDANRDWYDACQTQECTRVFPDARSDRPGPTLVVVGDAEPAIVSPATFADYGDAACLDPGGCRSYYDMADFNADGIPSCPVQVIPADSETEVSRALSAASQWNANQFVRTDGRVAVFAGDEFYGGTARWLELHGQAIIDAYAGSGRPNVGESVESQVPIWDQMVVGRAAINSGIDHLWIEGMDTGSHRLTGFLEGCVYSENLLSTKQRIAIFAPTCQSGATWDGSGGCTPLVEKLMFNDPEKTMAATFVGQLNLDWEYRHRRFCEILKSEVLSAAEGTPMSIVTYKAARAMAEAGHVRYARGVVCYGADVRVRHRSDPSTVPDGVSNGIVKEQLELRVRPNPSAGKFRMAIGGATQLVTITICDVGGRVVKELSVSVGTGGSGFIEADVDMEDVDGGRRGVYFALAKEGRRRSSQKLVIFR